MSNLLFETYKKCTDNIQASGYPGVPGVFTLGQIFGWKCVTEAVHAICGFIYCQIWHVGRVTVPSLIDMKDTSSSSEILIRGKAIEGSEYASNPPKSMTIEEIKDIIAEFGAAPKRCIQAGFDGVEFQG